MDESELTELRRLIGRHEKLVFEAIKAGMVAELPHESQLYAQAVQEHMHLKHVHNAAGGARAHAPKARSQCP